MNELLRLDLFQEELKLVILELEAKRLDIPELEKSDAFASSTFVLRRALDRLIF